MLYAYLHLQLFNYAKYSKVFHLNYSLSVPSGNQWLSFNSILTQVIYSMWSAAFVPLEYWNTCDPHVQQVLKEQVGTGGDG